MGWWNIGKEVFDVFMDVRGAVAMFMFIIEEAIQTVGMVSWIYYKEKKIEKMKENERWIKDNLATPLKEFAESPSGYIAFPLNIAYKKFAEATIRKADLLQQI